MLSEVQWSRSIYSNNINYDKDYPSHFDRSGEIFVR